MDGNSSNPLSQRPSTSSRKITSDDPATAPEREKLSKKTNKKSNSTSDPSLKTKRTKNKNKNNTNVSSASSSPPNKKPRRSENVSKRKASNDESDEDSIDDACNSQKDYSQLLPEIGDEVAIKCPPDPPYPEGWYSGVVIEVIRHDLDCFKPSNKKSTASTSKPKDFTIHVEWDGGGVEKLRNPEWRMKGDEPDKQGRISHRDARLRPYFKYWVNRLNSINEAEKKLSRTRAGKNMRVDSSQKIEWIKCSNPNCGKWRALPTYLKSTSVLESCNNTWFCVLNTWDEGMASCAAHQETGYMPLKVGEN
ncbi:hypothetical protein HJC23_009979 [Cyclotella cryptica]|uniref:CW-type domain-containing protein n=1 Tax=Cyclotella cryptica TaxID=29204 RepID=A0ABD3Q9U4_9STRA